MQLKPLAIILILLFQLLALIPCLGQETASYWNSKANEFYNNRSYDLSLICSDKSLEINSSNAETWIIRGRALSGLNRSDETMDSYQNAIKVNPLSKEAWNGKASSLRSSNQYDEALKCYDYIIAIDSKDTEPWLNKAEIFFKNIGKYDEALKCYDKYIAKAPNDDLHLILYWKAEVLFSLGRYDEALSCCDEVIKYYKNRNKDSFYLGTIFLEANILKEFGKYNEALKRYDWLIYSVSKDPSDDINYILPLYKANVLREMGRYSEAAGWYIQAIFVSLALWPENLFLLLIFLLVLIIVLYVWKSGWNKLDYDITAENIDRVIADFHIVRDPTFRLFLDVLRWAIFPIAIIILYKEDWLLIPGILSLSFILFAFRPLARRIPDTLNILFKRDIIAALETKPNYSIYKENEELYISQNKILETKLANFIRYYEAVFDMKAKWIMAILFAFSWIGVTASMEAIFFKEEQIAAIFSNDYITMIHVVIEFFIAFLIGFMTWKMLIISILIHDLGEKFDINPKLGNPDSCGGLSPIGNLCLLNSIMLSIPGIYMSGLILLILVLVGKIDPYSRAPFQNAIIVIFLLIPISMILSSFFLSQWSIHKKMIAKRDAAWEELSHIEIEIHEIYTKMKDQLRDKDNLIVLAKNLELTQKIYLDKQSQKYPLWPFNLTIFAKLVTSIPLIVVPLLGLIQKVLEFMPHK